MKKVLSIICLLLILTSFISCTEEYPSWTVPNDTNNKNNSSGNKDNGLEEIFKPKPTIYFETNGGTPISPITMGSHNIQLPIPTKTDHTFEGWYLNAEFTHEPTYPFTPEEDVTLYAKWIKTKIISQGDDQELKMWFDKNSEVTYYITPNGLDLYALQASGYRIKITVSYDVYYRKTYDVPFDIGYAGSPKYEVYLNLDDSRGKSEEDLGTSTSRDSRTITYTANAADFINKNVTLKFSTDNIQNTIYFKNVLVTYECYK